MKLVIAMLCLAAIVLVPGAAALQYEGEILMGQPSTHSPVWGVGTHLARCEPDSQFNGIDVVWFQLPEGSHTWPSVPVRLTVAPTLAAGVFFWTPSCSLIQNFSCAHKGLGNPVSCNSPTNIAFISVEGFLGTGAFTATLEPSLPADDAAEEEASALPSFALVLGLLLPERRGGAFAGFARLLRGIGDRA